MVSVDLTHAEVIPPQSPLRGTCSIATAYRATSRPLGDPALDRVAALALELVGGEWALICLLTDVWTVVGAAGGPGSRGEDTGCVIEALSAVIARSRSSLAVSDAAGDVRLRAARSAAVTSVGAFLGAPLKDAGGAVIGTICVISGEKHAWSDMDRRAVTRLAGFAVAEVQHSVTAGDLGTHQTRWVLAVGAAEIGGFDVDVTADRISLDARMEELFGFAPGEFDGTVAAFYSRIHPDDADRVARADREAIAERSSYEVEFRVVRPDHTTRWIRSRARVLSDACGGAVRVLGAAYDTTDARDLQTRMARALDAMSAPFISLDTDWRVSFINAAAERVSGQDRQDVVGHTIWDLWPDTIGTEFEFQYRRAMDSGESVHFEACAALRDVWYEVSAAPTPDGLLVQFQDVTVRRQDRKRAALLSQVTTDLVRTLDPRRAAEQIAEMVVPAIADWCLVSLTKDGRAPDGTRLEQVGTAHRSPSSVSALRRYAEIRRLAVRDPSVLNRWLMAEGPRLIPADATEEIGGLLLPGEARDLLGELAPSSVIVIPLRASGPPLGLLSLFYVAGSGHDARSEADIAAEIAGRVALALENVRLADPERTGTGSLQRALLTPANPGPELDAAVRYVPGAAGARPDGDWYDVFRQRSGTTVAVVGDAGRGRDRDAGAVMAQLSGLLRGVALRGGSSPAALLHGMDDAIDLLGGGTGASAVVAQLVRPSGAGAPDRVRLRWSNAGHPPPLLVDPDGGTTVLRGNDAEPPLGLHAAARRSDHTAWLPTGSTLLMYTDGLVDRSASDGVERLRDTVAQVAAAGAGLDELVDEVLRRALPGSPRHAAAVTALRVRPPAVAT